VNFDSLYYLIFQQLNVLGEGFSLTPKLRVERQFTSCQWGKWGGELGISGNAEVSATWPFLTPTPVPVPMYVKVSINGSVNTSLAVEDIVLEPPKADFTGNFGISPSIRGSLGVGADELLSAEGWVQGTANVAFQYPAPTPPDPIWSNLKTLTGSLEGGLAAQILIWKWENALLKCEWNAVNDQVTCGFPRPSFRSKFLTEPSLIPRDYLNNPDHGKFTRSTRGLRDSATDSVTLQAAVYPYSDVNLSGNDKTLYAVWVADNPSRSSTPNRR